MRKLLDLKILSDKKDGKPVSSISSKHRKVYDKLAFEYENKAKLHVKVTELQISHLAPLLKPGARVLDVGCGVGLAISIMRKYGLRPEGIDISARMSKYAMKRNPESRIVRGDILTTAAFGRFDAILAQSVIHLFPSEELSALFDKFRVILRTKGILVVSTTDSRKSFAGFESKADYRGGGERYRRHWRRQELCEFLEQQNFSVKTEWDLRDSFDKDWMVFACTRNK